MILSSGSSSSNANGLIKMDSRTEQNSAGCYVVEIGEDENFVEMALLVGLPSAIEDTNIFFSRCKLSTGFGKGCANKHGGYMSPRQFQIMQK